MAYIKKRGSKKELVRDIPMPAVVKDTANAGALRFEMHIGDVIVSLAEMERDIIISTWLKQAKLHQSET